ncbi:sugar phosphate nucleotidyltransferase [Evansella sp. AB-P1]|uniref:sugar phosphate nucleotidyltransferase n=1 Tax=Evansella sp. AB-P1 TaxID=3037653 RepID=UPI00241D8FA6|nr:sugar phosphate nucleotidyltransferase [Evansella sp. AB-P1]MDG5787884.1 sugar phosphate nucleotidyltransferase [Evansella sp. AB-P1]
MELILLSGGSGKRLWPLSNDARSKQFLRLLENKEGILESMVQRVWKQLAEAGLQDNTVIATSKSQVDIIQNQLGSHVPLIVEPERRDTFPAIALSAVYLYSVKGVSLHEVIGVLPVDPYVETEFFQHLEVLEKSLLHSKAELALIGIEPTYPSEKYGYIVPNTSKTNYFTVDYFKEKPSEEDAQVLINEENARWNSGVFAFKLEYVINYLKQNGFPTTYDELLHHYDRLPKISFDYEVVEQAKDVIAISYDGYWKDLGTWNTLTEEMGTEKIGKGMISHDSLNTHLVNELDIPVTILGLSNIVVALSPDGLLVTDKQASPRLKNELKITQRPMYEERRWGWYKVLDYTKYDGNEVLTKRLGILAGRNLSYQLHFKRSEVWTVVKGHGEFVMNGKMKKVRQGDVLQIPVRSRHAIRAITDMEIIEVQSGSELIEEDIKRICLTWDEVTNLSSSAIS